MRREIIAPRPGWQQKLEQLGFDFYVLDSKAYWTEQACYAFTADQIDELEASTEELHGLCLKAVEHVNTVIADTLTGEDVFDPYKD